MGQFTFEIAISNKGPSAAFVGNATVKLEDDRDPLLFELALQCNATSGDLSLVMHGTIDNPFGLSKRLTLGAKKDEGLPLGIQVNAMWAQLIATGIPSGLGLSGSFVLDKDKPTAKSYGMLVNLSENPLDFILIIEATEMTFAELLELHASMSNTPPLPIDAPDITLRNLEIYASLGGSFGSTTYPPGFRLKGIISINGTEAFFSCSISFAGLELIAYVPSFKLGPLTVTGKEQRPAIEDWPPAAKKHAENKAKDVAKTGIVPVEDKQIYSQTGLYAKLDLTAKLTTQRFIMKGHVTIFDVTADVDITCQYKPDPNLNFDFTLRWNHVLFLDLHANKVGAESIPGSQPTSAAAAQLSNVENADFKISAKFQPEILSQVVGAVDQTLSSLHETLNEGVGKAMKLVEEAEAAKVVLLKQAEDKLAPLEQAFAAEKARIEKELKDLDKTSKTKRDQLSGSVTAAEAEKRKQDTEAPTTRDRDIGNAKTKRDNDIVGFKSTLRSFQNTYDTAKAKFDQSARDAAMQLSNIGMTAGSMCRSESLKFSLSHQAEQARQGKENARWLSDAYVTYKALQETCELILRDLNSPNSYLIQLFRIFESAQDTYNIADQAPRE